MGEWGVVDVAGCCAICHSADRYAGDLSPGPCLATLPGGGSALVCCAARKQLREVARTEAGIPGGTE